MFSNDWGTAPVVLNLLRLFDPTIGPGSILGGAAGVCIAGYIASRRIAKAGCACDAFAPVLALAMAVGRVGCFLSMEDGLGKTTSLPWGVWVETANAGGYLAHPTPLYDMAFNLASFGVLLALRDRPAMQNGNLLKMGLAGYVVFRFFIEFVRNNSVLWWGLTGQQFFCLGLLAAWGIYYLKKSGWLTVSRIHQAF